jgi:hypothetical protein
MSSVWVPGPFEALGGIRCPETVPNEPQLRQKGQLRRHHVAEDVQSFMQQPEYQKPESMEL